MKLRKITILILLFYFIFHGMAKSQDITQVYKSVVPPSPTAYELGKYGYSPTGNFNGAANYSIPLYELKGKNLSLPISLSYYSN